MAEVLDAQWTVQPGPVEEEEEEAAASAVEVAEMLTSRLDPQVEHRCQPAALPRMMSLGCCLQTRQEKKLRMVQEVYRREEIFHPTDLQGLPLEDREEVHLRYDLSPEESPVVLSQFPHNEPWDF